MNKTRRKDYTLYLKLKGTEIGLLKGTLSEIDEFTTYFVDASAMYKKFTSRDYENFQYEFFIKSSKNNRYPVLYYKYRKLLNSSNINQVMVFLKQLSREELISFLDNNTPIIYYIENNLDDNKIPLCELYNNLTNGLSYNYSLNKYIKSDYKNYRNATMHIISRFDLKLKDFPFVDIDNYKKIISSIRDNIMSKLSKIENEVKIDDSINNDLFEEPIETLNEKIYSIINNDNLDIYEKEEELELLIDDEDKLRDTKGMLYHRKM